MVFYTTWQPVRINAGGGPSAPNGESGFYINSTGLQWTSAPNQKPGGTGNQFGGWLGEFLTCLLGVEEAGGSDELLTGMAVCNWWHANTIQLFFRMKYYNPSPIPSSCADVYLIPQYI